MRTWWRSTGGAATSSTRALTAIAGRHLRRCPGGAFYVFPNVRRYLRGEVPTTLELAGRLLEEQKVAVVPGEGFGAPGYLRLSFARPMDELKEGARRIAAFLGRRARRLMARARGPTRRPSRRGAGRRGAPVPTPRPRGKRCRSPPATR